MTVSKQMERIANLEQLAKDKFGDNFLWALWGSAQVLLNDGDLETMERVFAREV